MGNIISSSSGLGPTELGSGKISDVPNPFLQNMNDILLELNLNNKGNYNYTTDSQKNGPRSEFDYYKAFTDPPPIGSVSSDLYDLKGRPKNSRGQYIDIFGMPYVTDETTKTTDQIAKKDKLDLSNDGFYNIKRAVCNMSKKAPVSMIGVDLPASDPDMRRLFTNRNLPGYETNLHNKQLSNLKLPSGYPTDSVSISNAVNNCLTWGSIYAPSASSTVPDNINTWNNLPIPDINIPNSNIYQNTVTANTVDPSSSAIIGNTGYVTTIISTPSSNNVVKQTPIQHFTNVSDIIEHATNTPTPSTNNAPSLPLSPISNLILNDYGNKRASTPTQSPSTYSPHNIYDQPLSSDCVNLLNSMVYNSYTVAELDKYSKFADQQYLLNSITTQNIDTGSTVSLVHDYSNNNIALIPGNVNTVSLPSNFSVNTTKKYTALKAITNQGTTGSADFDMNTECKSFENDLCEWYYYYDINDAFTANRTSPITFENRSNYLNNVQYLSSHIPDCRCSAVSKLSQSNIYDNYYINSKCQTYNSYSSDTHFNDVSYNNYPKYPGTSMTNKYKSIYNVSSGSVDYVPFRTQLDPTISINGGLGDSIYGVVAGNLRGQGIQINNYSCNIENSVVTTNTGGNVIVGNFYFACNFPGSGAPATTDVGSGITFVYNNVYYMNNSQYLNIISLPDISSSLPVKNSNFEAFTQIKVEATPNSVMNCRFLATYQFILYINGDKTSSPIVCPYTGSNCPTGINTSPDCIPNSCAPYILRIPFIYGNSYIANTYQLFIRNNPDFANTNKVNLTGYSLSFTVQQYNIYINSYIPDINSNGSYSVKINIVIETKCPQNLPVRVVLISTSNVNNTVYMYNSSLLNALSNTNTSNGNITSGILTLTSGGSGVTGGITNQSYNLKVMLNETQTASIYTGGVEMNVSNSISTPYVINFASLVPTFTSTSLEYIDNNNLSVVIATQTIPIGATLKYNWTINNLGSVLSRITIYYDTNINYIPSSTVSPTRVAIATASSLGTLSGTSNTGSINFICPLRNGGNIIFYAIASGTGTTTPIYSSTKNVSLPPITALSNINSWTISQYSTISDSAKVSLTSTQTPMKITDYFALGSTYKYIIYTPGSLSGTTYTNPTFFGSNITPIAAAGGSNPGYIIFTNPNSVTNPPIIKITSIKSSQLPGSPSTFKYSFTPSASNSVRLELGASLIINYQLINFTSNQTLQLKLGTKTITTINYNKDTDPSQGTISFTVFGDISIANIPLYMKTISEIQSQTLSVTLNNNGADTFTVSPATVASSSSVTITDVSNPALKINAAAQSDSVLSTMNISYKSFLENEYFTELSSFSTQLNISTINLSFPNVNFSTDFNYVFYSNLINGFTSNISHGNEMFTNARQLYLDSKNSKIKKINKKQKLLINSNELEEFTEHYSTGQINQLTIDKLTFNFATGTFGSQNNINLTFAGYTNVTISNLILSYGTLTLDNRSFRINILPDATIGLDAVLTINNIIFVGNLTSNGKITITNPTPGTNIKYSVLTCPNSVTSLPLIVPCINNSDGTWSAPADYAARLTNQCTTGGGGEIGRAHV